MPDLRRVGGASAFGRVGRVAEAHDVPVSGHLFPERGLGVLGGLAHAMTPGSMPGFSDLDRERLDFADGSAIVPERPGFGSTFDEERIRHLERQDG